MNKGVFVGRVGQDAEMRYTQSGTAVASFSLALDNGKDKEGEKRQPTWIKAVMWDKRAESLAQYVTKGKLVIVVGPVSTEAWTDKNSGDAKSKIVVTVNEFEFGGGGKDDKSDTDSQPQTTPSRHTQRDEAASTQIQDEDIPF